MNSRYTLAFALLLSALPAFTHTKTDSDCLRDINLKSGDAEAAVIWLLSERLPDVNGCPLSNIIKREVIIDRVDAHITHGALNVEVDLPSAGSVAVINNDEALHVLYVVAQDLLNKKATGDVLNDAAKTYVSEKLATLALWVLAQTNLEGLLPDSITSGRLYNFARHELARCGVAKAIHTVCNK